MTTDVVPTVLGRLGAWWRRWLFERMSAAYEHWHGHPPRRVIAVVRTHESMRVAPPIRVPINQRW